MKNTRISGLGGLAAIFAALLLLLPSVGEAQDVTLTPEGKVPGKPFQILQGQLDDLQNRVTELERVEGQTVPFTCGGTTTLGEAVANLKPGDTLEVSGTCNPHGLVLEGDNRGTMDGGGTATLTCTNPDDNAVEVRGRGWIIKNFAKIKGCRNGILVTRGGTAIIDNNIIGDVTDPNRTGIKVSQGSSAIIINNTIQNTIRLAISITSSSALIGILSSLDIAPSPNIIQNNSLIEGRSAINLSRSASAIIVGNAISGNGGNGIRVSDSSAARIGFFGGPGARVFMFNTISGNGGSGIIVARSSEARISDNTISSNTGNGIDVRGNSQAHIGFPDSGPLGLNTIDGNGGRGIRVRASSSARIIGNTISNNTREGIKVEGVSQASIDDNTINNNGRDGIFVQENSGVNISGNTGNNVGDGVDCRTGSYALGSIGTLDGGVFTNDTSCIIDL